jgi:hypothetical protein
MLDIHNHSWIINISSLLSRNPPELDGPTGLRAPPRILRAPLRNPPRPLW